MINCKECKYWFREECHLSLPVVGMTYTSSGVWPWTDGDDCCGQGLRQEVNLGVRGLAQ